MIIKVKHPGDCPLRDFSQSSDFVCAIVHSDIQNMPCEDSENFPADCPLHSRTVIIEKEDSGAEVDPPPPPEPPPNVE